MAEVDLGPAVLDVRAAKGDDVDGSALDFVFKDGDGNAIDLTGYAFKAKIENEAESKDWNLTITDAANGKAEPDVDTADMSGRYGHYIVLVEPSGDERTYLAGTFYVEAR